LGRFFITSMGIAIKIFKEELEGYGELNERMSELAVVQESETITELVDSYIYRPMNEPLTDFVCLLRLYGISYEVISEES
jgi:hypothetical protein